MKHLTLIFAILLSGFSVVAQNETTDSDAVPSLYEWFFPADAPTEVKSTVALKTKKAMTKRFRRKADRMAVRWLRRAERSRKNAECLMEEAEQLIEKARALKNEAILKDREALFFEAEKAKLLNMRFE